MRKVKIVLSWIVIIVLIFCSIFSSLALDGYVEGRKYGDVDGNGIIDISDVTCIQKSLAKLIPITSDMLLYGDVKGMGFNIVSGTCIQRFLVNLETNSRIGEEAENDKYTVTYKDYDGTILKKEKVSKGNSSIPPKDPYRFGYKFLGWDKLYTNITQNTEIFALYVECTDPTIFVESKVVNKEDKSVDVKIFILNNPGISSLKLSVQTESFLTLNGVSFDPNFGTYVTAPEPYKNPQAISLVSPLADVNYSGTFVTLNFAIDNVDDLTSSKISVTYDQENTFNVDFEDVEFDVVNGSVEIK